MKQIQNKLPGNLHKTWNKFKVLEKSRGVRKMEKFIFMKSLDNNLNPSNSVTGTLSFWIATISLVSKNSNHDLFQVTLFSITCFV